MSVSTEAIHEPPASTSMHPLFQRYVSTLGNYIGVISKFVVQKKVEEWDLANENMMKKRDAQGIANLIILETLTLIGPQKANSLKDEFMIMIDEYFKEDEADEQ